MSSMPRLRPIGSQPALAVTAWFVLAVTALLLPVAGTQLHAAVSFMPALFAAVGCFDVLSVCLLIGGYRDKGDVRLLAMAAAYGWSLVAMTGYALAFPGTVAEHPPLAGTPSVAPYLYLLWHGGFPVLLGLAASPWPAALPRLTRLDRRAAIAWRTMTVTVTVAAAVVTLLVVNAASLPTLIVGLDSSRMTALTAPVVLPLVALALAAAWVGTRGRTGPDRWCLIAILVCACDLTLTYVSGHRYSLGWYGGRTLTLVAAGVAVVSMLASFRRLAAIAEHHATHDALTGLANRRCAYDVLEQMLTRARHTRRPLGVVSLDLDHFKRINDEYGHETGDVVLRAVGTALAGECRGADLVARVGGEEFLVLLPDTDTDGTMAAAEKLRLAIAALVVPSLPHGLTASLGVATMTTVEDEISDLLRRADQALYVAKNAGRNRSMAAGTTQTPHLPLLDMLEAWEGHPVPPLVATRR